MSLLGDTSDAQPFLGGQSYEENTIRSRDSPNDEFTLAPIGPSSIDSANYTPRLPVKDNAWATAFKVNVSVTVLCALYFGSTGLKKLADLERLVERYLEHEEGSNSPKFRVSVLLILVVACSAVATIVTARSRTLLRMMIVWPKFIIKVSTYSPDCMYRKPFLLRACSFPPPRCFYSRNHRRTRTERKVARIKI